MTDTVSRREFDNLNAKVEKQDEKLNATALDIREIKTNQKNDSKKLDGIADNMEKISAGLDQKIKDMSKDVALNKIQIAKLVVITTPINGLIAYAVVQLVK